MPLKGKPASPSTVIADNRRLVLEALREHQALTRTEIVELTTLSQAAVARITTALEHDHLIRKTRQTPSSGGRPAWEYGFTAEGRYVAGVRVRATGCEGILMGFDEKIVERHRVDVPDDEDARADERLEALFEVSRVLTQAAGGLGRAPVAMGVAVPGVADSATGDVHTVPEVGWSSLPLGSMMAKVSDARILIENDANCLALSEVGGSRSNSDSMAAVVIDHGIGVGLISDGRIHRGNHFEAGEVGYLLTGRDGLTHSFGAIGDMESRMGSAGLGRRAAAIGLGSGERMRLWDLMDLAATGDERARQLADETLDYLSMALASVTAVFDPSRIVLGEVPRHWESVIVQEVSERLIHRSLRLPQLDLPQHGPDGVLMGVAVLAASAVDLQSL